MQIKNNLIKIIKLVTKNFIIFLRMIFGLFFVIGFSVSAVEFILYMSQADWRVGLCILFSVILAIYSCIVFFFKTKVIVKIIYVILFFAYPYLPNSIPSVVKYKNDDTCSDIGICAEGVKWGKDIITKDFCLKNNWKWDEKRKSCNVREKQNNRP